MQRHIGERFGRYTLLKLVSLRPNVWLCRCDCGIEKPVGVSNLISGTTRSCGCLQREKLELRKAGKDPRLVVYNYYKRNAKLRGIVWGLSHEQFNQLIAEDCYYCGAPPRERTIMCGGRYPRAVPTVASGVDRLDNQHGYVPDNIVSCCETCNRAKLCMTATEFIAWAVGLVHHQQHKGGVQR